MRVRGEDATPPAGEEGARMLQMCVWTGGPASETGYPQILRTLAQEDRRLQRAGGVREWGSSLQRV